MSNNDIFEKLKTTNEIFDIICEMKEILTAVPATIENVQLLQCAVKVLDVLNREMDNARPCEIIPTSDLIEVYSNALAALNSVKRHEVIEWWSDDDWNNTIVQRRAVLALELADLIGKEMDNEAMRREGEL